ncbi:MAG TPA: hypothetical protein VFR05_11260, partial [Terriglobia bacterium]|nr:hypothetical protein [Terriglobia bacterium]
QLLQDRHFPYVIVEGLFGGTVLEMRIVWEYEETRIAIDLVSAIGDNVDINDVRQRYRQLPHNMIQ